MGWQHIRKSSNRIALRQEKTNTPLLIRDSS